MQLRGLPKVDQEVKTIGNSSWDWTGGFYYHLLPTRTSASLHPSM